MDELVLQELRAAAMRKLKFFFDRKDLGLRKVPGTGEGIDAINNVACILLTCTWTTPDLVRMEESLARMEEELKFAQDELVYILNSLPVELRRDYALPKRPSPMNPHWDFPTVAYRGKRVPFYSLPDVLGESLTAELLRDSPYQGTKAIAVIGIGQTRPPQEALLKLQCYLGNGDV